MAPTTTTPPAERLRAVADELDGLLAGLDPERCDVNGALGLLGSFSRIRRAAAAGEALVARRADECDAHATTGHRSTAHLLADLGGTSIGRASELVETGKRLRTHTATDEALRAGTVSIEQAHAVTTAAEADPGTEADLLALAGRESLRRLTERARDVRLAADDDRVGRYRRQHAARSLRHGRDDDGMVWGRFRLPPDLGAAVVNRLERRADHEFRAARSEGRHEEHDRYLADALAALVEGGDATSGGKGGGKGGKEGNSADRNSRNRNSGNGRRGAEVVVHVSRDALVRGRVERGEHCMVQGVGPVPVEVAREIADDAFLKGVLVDGTDVVKVRHFGRRRPAELRTALETRSVLLHGDVQCSADGCDQRLGLEWDHAVPHSRGGPTSYDNLRPLCRHHHRAKTSTDGRAPP